ncbi:hypothetical protein RB653_000629 [Dictyostelium firmibasis]|uniref:Uncharacterized protein n=1 Tax=Dictyostelium firmibasis TaxID=79012 RepID=A0AAN7TX09_9MYCE
MYYKFELFFFLFYFIS